MKRKVFSYIRFSTKVQAKGSSKDRQWTMARDFAEKHDYELVDKSFSDLGVSGFKAVQRNGLESLLEAIDTQAIPKNSIIVIEAVDRLSRLPYRQARKLIEKIVDKGVDLYVCQDDLLITNDNVDSLETVIVLALKIDLAHKESVQKSQRVKAAKDRKKVQGLDGKKTKKVCPKWLSWNDESQTFEFNDYVDTVRYIIELKQAGGTENTITIDLNNSPYVPPRAKAWNPTSIRKILSSHALYGAWMTSKKVDNKWVDDELILNHYPSVVSYEEWQLLTPKKRISNTGRASYSNHFRGLTRCARCNSVMTKKRSIVGGKEYIQYRCNWSAKRLGCEAMPINAEKFERIIRAYSRKIEYRVVKVDENESMRQELAKKELSYKQLTDALTTGGDISALITAVSKLDTEIKALKESLLPVDDTKENVQRLLDSWDTPTKWNNLAHRFLKAIYVDVVGELRSKKYLHVELVQHDGHIIKTRHIGAASEIEWPDISKWL